MSRHARDGRSGSNACPTDFTAASSRAPLTDFLGDATTQHPTLCDGPVETARIIHTAYLRNL
ncbi:hypothetical protein GCM10018780_82150 [Streptomyces lanatus]|nr:hypothetical protein GCM10018780_82150 [Streptomyces lanatus]